MQSPLISETFFGSKSPGWSAVLWFSPCQWAQRTCHVSCQPMACCPMGAYQAVLAITPGNSSGGRIMLSTERVLLSWKLLLVSAVLSQRQSPLCKHYFHYSPLATCWFVSNRLYVLYKELYATVWPKPPHEITCFPSSFTFMTIGGQLTLCDFVFSFIFKIQPDRSKSCQSSQHCSLQRSSENTSKKPYSLWRLRVYFSEHH